MSINPIQLKHKYSLLYSQYTIDIMQYEYNIWNNVHNYKCVPGSGDGIAGIVLPRCESQQVSEKMERFRWRVCDDVEDVL